MRKKTEYQKFKERALRNPQVRRAYKEGLDDLRIAVRVAELREKRGLTQTQLAAKIQTSPAVISRLERGDNVELKTLLKIASALNARLSIEALPSRA
ncbi:MAG: helix-turn-helix transcriptional regulator [Acidobacteriia bacterium]|nr:helix-turn-helix transcriptional regulator [Terriglobia bacterium]